jgi:hypothetical protein
MAGPTYQAGTTWGVLPGSQAAGQELYGPMYRGQFGAMAPGDPNQEMQSRSWEQQYGQQDLSNQHQQQMWGRQNQIYDRILGGLGQQGYHATVNYGNYGSMIPAPQYANTGPIWSQQQINNQANSQRAQMMAGAANGVRQYATRAAQSGFSPMSPLTQFLQQTAGQRANIGAAQNETQLNWNAAQGNRQAEQAGEGINAGMYGSYTSALARARDQQLQAQSQGFNQNMQQYGLLASLLGRG